MRLGNVLLMGLWCAQVGAFAQAPVAALPPMGWNSWNHFAGRVTDADVRGAADQLVSTGMRDAGYVYINLDDTWQGKRDASGELHPNERFPDMKALAGYVHAKGLKFGIYSSPGAQTCGRYEGSLGHEAQDAKMYAAWGVDFLKYDLCSLQDVMHKLKEDKPEDPQAEYRLMIDSYRKMGEALRATGRPILLSLCEYGMAEPWKFGPGVGAQLWRTTDDIDDNYRRMMLIAESQVGLGKFAGPGRWNDPDMLEVGNGGMSTEEYQTHMGLWVVMAAPLLAGNDLGKMSVADKAILTNREAIAIDQDPLAKAGDRVWRSGEFSAWTKPLSGGRTALLIVNGSTSRRDLLVNLAEVGLPRGGVLREVWSGKDIGRRSGLMNLTLAGHASLLYVVAP